MGDEWGNDIRDNGAARIAATRRWTSANSSLAGCKGIDEQFDHAS
ncbi:MAG: hypothetical protein U5N53_06105 [Mycobacterium sp.]|nr:hypothetical protein [Mycobacterium sp.]